MAKTVSDTRVLQATSQPNMLVSSQFVIRMENLIYPTYTFLKTILLLIIKLKFVINHLLFTHIRYKRTWKNI